MSTVGDNLENTSHETTSGTTVSFSTTVTEVSNPSTDSNGIKDSTAASTVVPSASTEGTVEVTSADRVPAFIPARSQPSEERCCWICFATEEDNKLAAWVQPCQCRGTTKWVHQSCLHRWIDEKQKGNALRSVSCQQCQTEYIIVYPPMGNFAVILEGFDNIVKRLSPFIAAGAIVGSIYWTAVTYGAVTVLQIVGHKKGLALMENGDPLVLLIGLPAIPVGLVLGRMIRWEEAVLRIIRNKRSVARKFPLMSLIVPYPDEEEDDQNQNQTAPSMSDALSVTRILCGALLLPTISSLVGRLLFESVENTLHRTLLGGLTFITVKGILKIYLKQQQYSRKRERKVVDYTPSNVQHYIRHVRHSGGGADRDHDNLV